MQMRSHHQIHLNRRDLAILRSLAEARYLSIQAIEWLHWPGWWTRWDDCQARRAAGERGRRTSYRVADAVYERLRKLTQAGLIALVDRPFVLAAEYRSRDPSVYEIATVGLRLLADYDALPLPVATSAYDPHTDAYTQLRQIEVGRIYAALRTRIEARGGKLTEWRAVHSLPPHAEMDMAGGTTGRGQCQRLAISPDATGQVQRLGRQPHRFFVEMARGMAADDWQTTVLAYEAYLDSDRYRERYGSAASTVLVFVTDDRQRQRLMDATTQATLRVERYLFGLVNQIHPSTIANGWRQISQVKEARGQRIHTNSSEITLFG